MYDWEERWQQLCAAVLDAGLEVLKAAPDDDLIRAEGLRYVARLFRYGAGTQLEPKPTAAPVFNFEGARIGGDNPDYRYGAASLNGSLSYVLTIRPNDAARLGIGTYSGGLGTGKGLLCDGYLNSEDLVSEPDGSFRIFISSTHDGSASNHLPIGPETNSLLIRETLVRPGTDRPAEMAITSMTAGAQDSPMSSSDLDVALTRLAPFMRGTVKQFLGWTNAFAATPNQIHPLDPSFLAAAQGDAGTLYHNGYFDLPDAETGLEVRFTPPSCRYWNLQGTSHWLESFDPVGAAVNLNNVTATVESDGSIRAIFALSDPGIPNWIDTAGHLRGCIALRVIGADSGAQPLTPECKLVALADLRKGTL